MIHSNSTLLCHGTCDDNDLPEVGLVLFKRDLRKVVLFSGMYKNTCKLIHENHEIRFRSSKLHDSIRCDKVKMAKIYNISFRETCCAGFSSSNDASLAPRKIVTSRVVSSGPASAMMPAASDVVGLSIRFLFQVMILRLFSADVGNSFQIYCESFLDTFVFFSLLALVPLQFIPL